MLFAIDPDEYFIDEEGVTVPSVLPSQSSRVYRAEFDTPESDCFARDGDAAFSK